MARSAGRPFILLGVAVLALLMVSPGALAGRPTAPDSSSRGTVLGSAGIALPTALAVPWDERNGYVPGWPSLVQQVRPLEGNVTVSLTFWPRDLSLFAPSAPGGAISLAQFQSEYSPTPAQYTSVESYLSSHGLHVVSTYPDRMSLTMEGPSAGVASAFGTSLLSGTFGGRAVELPAASPALPADIAPLISSVSGLSSGFTTFSLPYSPATLPSVAPVAHPRQGRTTSEVTPGAARDVYDVSPLYNYSGGTHYPTQVGIALVLWGDGFNTRDLSTFFSQYYPSEFPGVQIIPVPVDGAPSPGPGAAQDPSQAPLELTLDLEWSGSMAPGATLYAVYGPDGPESDQYSPTDASLEDALNHAVEEPNVRVISMSFATPDGVDGSFQAAFTTSFESAIALGITPVAASGDNGGTNNARGACTTTTQPEFPAASPLVLAVGGTYPVLSQSFTGAITGIESQPAWKDSGGGFSVDYSAPSWQLSGSAKSVISGNGRGIPDVAGPAAYNFLYFNGQPGLGNGTSFASPMWAGILATIDGLRSTPLGEVDQRLYSIGAAEPLGRVPDGLVDITSGGNCLGNAGTGWDTATGWGAPDAALLYEALSASYVNVSLGATPSPVAPGQTVSATLRLTNATSGAPIAGVPVNLTLSAEGFAGPCGGTLASSSATTDAAGTAVVSLTVPACFLGSRVDLVALVQSFGLYGMASATLAVNLLGLAGGALSFLGTYPYSIATFAGIMVAAVLVGWTLGERRRRRRYLRAREVAAAAALVRPPAMPTPPSGPAAPAPFVGTPPGPPGSGPPSSGPPVAPLPTVECPVCGMRFAPEIDFCPRCGNYLPGREPPAERGNTGA
jgi:kumamolisin